MRYILKMNNWLKLALGLSIISCILGIIIENKWFIPGFYEKTKIFMPLYKAIVLPEYLLELCYTISSVSLAIVSALLMKADERILNVSVKRLYFKEDLGIFNVPNMIVIILVLDVEIFFSAIFQAKVWQIFAFLIIYICVINLLWMTYAIRSKKSAIYEKIIKTLVKTKNDKFAKKLLQKWKYNYVEKTNMTVGEKVHNSYIAEDLYTIYTLASKVDMLHNDLITRNVNSIIEADNRSQKDTLEYLEQENIVDELKKITDRYIDNGFSGRFVEWVKDITKEKDTTETKKRRKKSNE